MKAEAETEVLNQAVRATRAKAATKVVKGKTVTTTAWNHLKAAIACLRYPWLAAVVA